jgi:hypothetical protein
MSGKNDRGPALRTQVKVFPLKAELPENFIQRPFFSPRRSVIGNRVQTDIMIPSPQTVEGIQPANRRVPFQNADAFPEIGQADSSSQPRHASTNDD